MAEATFNPLSKSDWDHLIKGFANDAKSQIIDPAAHAAESTINQAASAAKSDIEKVASDVKNDFTDIEGDVRKALINDAKKVVSYVERKGLGELVKILELTQDLLPNSVGVQVGPLGFDVDPRHDIDAIKKWAANPPDSLDDYETMLADFVPDTVSVDLSVQVDALVVGTEAIDITLTWNTRDDIADFMQHLEKLWGDATSATDVGEDPTSEIDADLS